jgi:hypothetical protein
MSNANSFQSSGDTRQRKRISPRRLFTCFIALAMATATVLSSSATVGISGVKGTYNKDGLASAVAYITVNTVGGTSAGEEFVTINRVYYTGTGTGAGKYMSKTVLDSEVGAVASLTLTSFMFEAPNSAGYASLTSPTILGYYAITFAGNVTGKNIVYNNIYTRS